jgi:hypothetical protein
MLLNRLIAEFSIASQLLHHDQACCRQARHWLKALDRSYSYHDGTWHPPAWLLRSFTWGPVQWPLAWCQVPHSASLDCGALAAIAIQLFRWRGDNAWPIQLVFRYPTEVTSHWEAIWKRKGIPSPWIAGQYCYHEACLITRDAETQIWDPTQGRWLGLDDVETEHGTIMAWRLCAGHETEIRTIQWSHGNLESDAWTQIAPLSLSLIHI